MLRFCVAGNNNYYLRRCAGRILHLVIVRQRAGLHGPIGIWQWTEWSLVSGLGEWGIKIWADPTAGPQRHFYLSSEASIPPTAMTQAAPSTAPVPFPLSPSPSLRSWTPEIQLWGLGERCELLQRALGRSPSRNRIYDIWWQQF